MDKIILKDMIFYGCHGTKDFEKHIGQKFLVSIELFLDLEGAGKSDNLKDTVDYEEIYNLVKNIQSHKKFNLLESLAENIALEILKHRLVKSVFLQIKKPLVLLGGPLEYVAVEIYREKQE